MTIHLTVKTNQEAYDAVKAHLSGMPRRARNADGFCVYCTDDGGRCAVGVLLDCSDDEARGLPADDMRDVRHLIDFGAVVVGLLRDLQEVHDDYRNWTDDGFVGHDELRSIAERWELTP